MGTSEPAGGQGTSEPDAGQAAQTTGPGAPQQPPNTTPKADGASLVGAGSGGPGSANRPKSPGLATTTIGWVAILALFYSAVVLGYSIQHLLIIYFFFAASCLVVFILSRSEGVRARYQRLEDFLQTGPGKKVAWGLFVVSNLGLIGYAQFHSSVSLAGPRDCAQDLGIFQDPFGTAVDDNGNLYVSDKGQSMGNVYRIARDCHTSLIYSGPNTPLGLAVNQGHLYVGFTFRNAVATASPGNPYGWIAEYDGPQGQAPPSEGKIFLKNQVYTPQGLAFDGHNNLW